MTTHFIYGLPANIFAISHAFIAFEILYPPGSRAPWFQLSAKRNARALFMNLSLWSRSIIFPSFELSAMMNLSDSAFFSGAPNAFLYAKKAAIARIRTMIPIPVNTNIHRFGDGRAGSPIGFKGVRKSILSLPFYYNPV